MSHEPFPTEHPAVVTVGLLYANGPLHVGHLRGYVAGDVYARALRRLGQETAFVCGSDMHGTPVAVNAEAEDRDPEDYALEWHEHNAATYPEFGIEFDNYGHTREPSNVELTTEFVESWIDGDHVVSKEIQVAWDPEVDQPLPDRYVEGTCPYCGADARGDECDDGCQRHLEPGEIEDPTSVITGNPAEYRTREHEFLRLSDFQDYLQGFIDRLEGTENARNQPREWIEGELQDLCITRDMDWGIDYPEREDGPEDLVLYVWVDAPIEYVASTKDYAERSDFDWEAAWGDGEVSEADAPDGGEIVHVIGKDIIQHHTVFWPAMLRGAGYHEPRAVVATGFVTMKGKGLSTSRNRAIWAADYLESDFHPDLLRYYLTAVGGLQQDVDFSWERFQEVVNTELVGALGNFVYRSLLFAHRTYDGTPEAEVSPAVRDRIEDAVATFEDAVGEYANRELAHAAVDLARFGNEYIQQEEPWKLTDEDPETAAQVIRDCVQLSVAIAVLVQPVLPDTAERLWAQVGGPGSVHETTVADAFADPAERFEAPDELFAKVEDEDIEPLTAELEARIAESVEDGAGSDRGSGGEGSGDDGTDDAGADDTAGTDGATAGAGEADDMSLEPVAADRISFEEFQNLDIRVGEILEAEPIADADKLVKLEVDIGVETRQVVAGIKQLHDIETLPGKRVVLLANLEKAELFGVESNGMVLAAGEEADLLTTHEDADLGTKIR